MSRSGYRVDGRAHTLIRPAATDIGDRRVDIRVSRFWILLEQSHHRHHHAALTIAALWHVEIDPSLLGWVEVAVLRERLDCGHLAAAQTADWHLAGARGRAVNMHGASAALSDPATILRTGESDRIAQHPKQRGVRLDIDLVRLSVDGKRYHSSPFPRRTVAGAPAPVANAV